MCRLSIIIPVFNTAQYLTRCLESCLKQGLCEEDFEILLCNDGSTDDSLAIAQQLQELHRNVHVFSQLNGGAGSARNLGLKHAKGKYVMFVDSDDYLISNSIRQPLELCFAHNLDVCRFVLLNNLLVTNQNWESITPVATHIVYSGEDLITNPKVPLDTACSALYRMSFLKENKLFFSQLTSSEDVDFTLHIYLYANRVMFDDSQVYTYEIKDNTRGHPRDINKIAVHIKNDLAIASTIKNAACIKANSKLIVRALKMRSNSATVAALWTMFRLRKQIYQSTAKEVLEYAQHLSLYPVKGKTFSWRSYILAHLLLNHKKLLILRFAKAHISDNNI